MKCDLCVAIDCYGRKTGRVKVETHGIRQGKNNTPLKPHLYIADSIAMCTKRQQILLSDTREEHVARIPVSQLSRRVKL